MNIQISDQALKNLLKSLSGYATGKLLDVDTLTFKDISTPVPEPKPEPEPEPKPVIWHRWGKENETFTVPKDTKVRYGAEDKWVEKIMSGTFKADNITFTDPLFGKEKYLEAAIPAPLPPVVEKPEEPIPPVPPTPVQGIVLHKPYPVPTQKITVNLAQRGVKFDGSTDNSAVLIGIRNEFKLRKDVLIELVAQAGQINYSKNYWDEGLINYRLICPNGVVVLHCTGMGEWDATRDFTLHGGLTTYDHEKFTGGFKPKPSLLTANAKAGEMSIRVTAIEASQFKLGDRVFIYGYETQGQGWPINPRFFEWKVVDRVDTNGNIFFKEPLEKSYSIQWRDFHFPDDAKGEFKSGKPRIIKIHEQYPDRIEWTNVRPLPQDRTRATNGSAFRLPAHTVILNNVDWTSGNNGWVNVWASENAYVEYNNCKGGGWEIDKLVGTMIVTGGSDGGEMQAATGVQNLIFRKFVKGNFAAITPQNLVAEDTVFAITGERGTAALYSFEYYTGTKSWNLKNCTFKLVAGKAAYHIPQLEFTVQDVISNNTIVLPDGVKWDDRNHMPAKLIFQGNTITSKDGSVSGIVSDIVYINGTYHIQLSNVKGTISKGQVWKYRTVGNVTSTDNKTSDGKIIDVKL